MWPDCDFEVKLWRGGDSPAREFATRAAAEVTASLDVGPLQLEVSAVQRRPDLARDLSLADFYVWLNAAGLAWVRLDEHREHFARDPARADLAGSVTGFISDDGKEFSLPAADAVTAAQAVESLHYWLANGERWPGLAWS